MEVFLNILIVIVSLALIVVVLLQKGKSAGLSGAIAGGAEQLFGKSKARGLDLFLLRATIVLSIVFVLLAVIISFIV